MSEQFTEFSLPEASYVAFDATSLRDLIVDRLVDKGVFSDQVFAGSNISSIIDIVAYSYHVLMFYLNKTSSESMFTDAEIYENVNRIVKLLNYNPIGYRTSSASIEVAASPQLAIGAYTIPRYSFVNAGGIKYSFNRDITFSKTVTVTEAINSIGNDNLLYQGSYEQYPSQVATGVDFETVILSLPGTSNTIDYSNIDVYVKSIADDGSLKWSEYTQTESLFLESPVAKKYEKRLNESGNHEFKFGNGILGRKLSSGDEIVLYYLKSSGEEGVIAANTLNDTSMTLYSATLLNDILTDIKSAGITYMSFDQISTLTSTNPDASTRPALKESISSIKQNAPASFMSQNRLVTASDFETYINRNFGNIILDTKVVNNNDYIDGHFKYIFEDLKLDKPHLESRVLYNQVNFSSSTNFNNVYIYAVPRVETKTSGTVLTNFISPTQKSAIRRQLSDTKMLTIEPIIIDPVYMAIDLGVQKAGETLSTGIAALSRLVLVKEPNSQRDNDIIKAQAVEVIKNQFGINSRLGKLIDMNVIYNDLISIADVKDIYMTRSDDPSVKVPGITFLSWNPVYSLTDINTISQSIQLPYFKFPYLYDESCLLSKIDVV